MDKYLFILPNLDLVQISVKVGVNQSPEVAKVNDWHGVIKQKRVCNSSTASPIEMARYYSLEEVVTLSIKPRNTCSKALLTYVRTLYK